LNIDTLNAKKSLATGPVATPSAPAVTYALDTTVELKQAMSLEAKLGYATGAHTPFISLGFVSAKAEATQQIISNGGYKKAGAGSKNLSGFQWGVGYDFRFNRQWSGNAAFTSAKLGDLQYDTTYLPGSTFTSPAYGEAFTHKMTLTTFKVAVNYHF
jgi:outer membrane immunogenic protein